MKILVLSFYFPPDLSAGSYRMSGLVDELLSTSKDIEIDVFTTTPNRYKSYKPQINDKYNHRINIHRFDIYNHNNNFIGQVFAFILFAFKVLGSVKRKKWDIVFATSSRLMTAYLGSLISKKINAPLYLDIRDLFVDTIKDLHSRLLGLPLGMFLKFIERKTYLQAKKINLVSEGFNDYVKTITPNANISNYTNGIDLEFLIYDFEKRSEFKSLIQITYAGNIGSGQGLEKIIPNVASIGSKNLNFKIIGDGSTKDLLVKKLQEQNISNVEILNPISREGLLEIYNEADILFLHLNDVKAFEKVLPSKLFEYAATKKPIIAGVCGYSKRFIDDNINGAYTFEPCNENEMHNVIEKIIEQKTFSFEREDFCKRFARNEIMMKMSKDIINIK